MSPGMSSLGRGDAWGLRQRGVFFGRLPAYVTYLTRCLELAHNRDSRKFVSTTRVSGGRAGSADVRGRRVSVVRFCGGVR